MPPPRTPAGPPFLQHEAAVYEAVVAHRTDQVPDDIAIITLRLA